MSRAKKILILCTGNSARSQMAEGLLKHITQNEYEVFTRNSAVFKTTPTSKISFSEL